MWGIFLLNPFKHLISEFVTKWSNFVNPLSPPLPTKSWFCSGSPPKALRSAWSKPWTELATELASAKRIETSQSGKRKLYHQQLMYQMVSSLGFWHHYLHWWHNKALPSGFLFLILIVFIFIVVVMVILVLASTFFKQAQPSSLKKQKSSFSYSYIWSF